MKLGAMLILPFACLAMQSGQTFGSESIHHDIKMSIDPMTGVLAVQDQIRFSGEGAGASSARRLFVLHEGLNPSTKTEGARIVSLERPPSSEDFAVAKGWFDSTSVPLVLYALEIPAGAQSVTIGYQGPIRHELSSQEAMRARGFRETPGLISAEGVYLAGSTHWYPWFGDDLLTFNLEVLSPLEWQAVSQGRRTKYDIGHNGVLVRWECPHPQDEIFVVAARFIEYDDDSGDVEAMVFLRGTEPELAGRYLEVTGEYLSMYSRMLGPYPYSKFALIENFWETGYGMPSFTLLGPKVVRFPFILRSSYPHEILHNWWGNGVYVDYLSGNWCEGLTAYLSDFMFQEQRGAGAGYRQQALQKYTDYAARGKDFPLTAFRERRSSATEAVGYGKSLMFFHMLRIQLGDEAFVRGLRAFYRDHRFEAATFDDIESSLESASGKTLDKEFEQWVKRAGAPHLALASVKTKRKSDGYHITAKLEQTQAGEPYALRVPVAITFEGRAEAFCTVVEMTEAQHTLRLTDAARPLRIDVDPEFDVFRVLDRGEIPPALSGHFGAEKVLVVLPASADETMKAAYERLASTWQSDGSKEVSVVTDEDFETLDDSGTVWILGWENRLLGQVAYAISAYDAKVDADSLRVGTTDVPREGHAVALAARDAVRPGLRLAFVGVDTPEMIEPLARKLPHYHKYSYLGFEGDALVNQVKGRWPVVNSPLSRSLREHAKGAQRVARGSLPERAPLSEFAESPEAGGDAGTDESQH